MKLLIIAGPYEADRLRKAAVAGGFETVAVEPGESPSVWITAIHPDAIVLVSKPVDDDPAASVAQVLAQVGKIRSVPRGQVPIILVGDAEEAARLRPLANGFLARPVTAEDLAGSVRDALGSDAPGFAAAPDAVRSAAAAASAGSRGVVPDTRTASVGTPIAAVTSGSRPHGGRDGKILDGWAAKIDAEFDDDIRDAVRAVGVLRQATSTLTSSLSSSLHSSTESAAHSSLPDVRDEARATAAKPSTPPSPSTTSVSPSPSTSALSPSTSAMPPPSFSEPSHDEVELDLPSLLARMFLSRLSGRLTLTHGNARKHILFEGGHPILAGSTLLEDRMGQMLVRQGRLSAEQLADCAAEVTSGRRLGVVLVDRGLVKATELDPLVRHHYEDVMYSLFSWDRGAWTLATDSSASAENIVLSQHPAALILEGIRRAYSAERALAGLGGAHRVLRLRLTTGASDLLENMAISPEERNLILLFDGLRGLDEIRSLTGAPPERLYGVAWALYVLDRLDLVDGTSPAREPSGPIRTRSSMPAHGRDQATDRALLESRHALVLEGDYFQILDVPRDASAAEIRGAYERRMAELGPQALHPAVAAQWAPELREIRAVLAEAARLLADERLRSRYRDHLPPAPQGSMASPRSASVAEGASS